MVLAWPGLAFPSTSDTTCAVRLNWLDRWWLDGCALVNVKLKCQRYVLFFKVAALQNYATIILASVIPKSQFPEVAMWAAAAVCLNHNKKHHPLRHLVDWNRIGTRGLFGSSQFLECQVAYYYFSRSLQHEFVLSYLLLFWAVNACSTIFCRLCSFNGNTKVAIWRLTNCMLNYSNLNSF